MVLGLFHDGPAALPEDTVLGAYLGAYARDGEPDATDAAHPTRREERRQLAYDFDLLTPGGGGGDDDGLGLYVDGTRFVNAMAYLNSYDNQAPRANV